jgi:hypothetical protein
VSLPGNVVAYNAGPRTATGEVRGPRSTGRSGPFRAAVGWPSHALSPCPAGLDPPCRLCLAWLARPGEPRPPAATRCHLAGAPLLRPGGYASLVAAASADHVFAENEGQRASVSWRRASAGPHEGKCHLLGAPRLLGMRFPGGTPDCRSSASVSVRRARTVRPSRSMCMISRPSSVAPDFSGGRSRLQIGCDDVSGMDRQRGQ